MPIVQIVKEECIENNVNSSQPKIFIHDGYILYPIFEQQTTYLVPILNDMYQVLTHEIHKHNFTIHFPSLYAAIALSIFIDEFIPIMHDIQEPVFVPQHLEMVVHEDASITAVKSPYINTKTTVLIGDVTLYDLFTIDLTSIPGMEKDYRYLEIINERLLHSMDITSFYLLFYNEVLKHVINLGIRLSLHIKEKDIYDKLLPVYEMWVMSEQLYDVKGHILRPSHLVMLFRHSDRQCIINCENVTIPRYDFHIFPYRLGRNELLKIAGIEK